MSQPVNPRSVLLCLAGVLSGAALLLGGAALVLVDTLASPRVVHDRQSLEEGSGTCVAVSPDQIDPANEGKLVFTTGPVTGEETLRDGLLGVAAPAVKLIRRVEIYQWVEQRRTHRTGTPGHRTTTYAYLRMRHWVSQPVDSRGFHIKSTTKQRPTNVGSLPLPQESWYAKQVRLGSFNLARRQIDKLGLTKLPVTAGMVAGLPPEWKGRLHLGPDGILYLPATPGHEAKNPVIGDVRITYELAKPQTVSVLARQAGDSFEPWLASNGDTPLDDFRLGSVTKETMFTELKKENPPRSWTLPLLGAAAAAVGLCLIVGGVAMFRRCRPVAA